MKLKGSFIVDLGLDRQARAAWPRSQTALLGLEIFS